MQYFVILRILGLLLMLFSFTQLLPMVVGWLCGDVDVTPFLKAFFVLLTGGAVMWFPVRFYKSELRLRDGFLVVILFWTVLGVSGSLPLLLSKQLDITVTDAIFESISALTTTGATVITKLDDLPRSILFYRQQLQWLGGMGIIVLAVAPVVVNAEIDSNIASVTVISSCLESNNGSDPDTPRTVQNRITTRKPSRKRSSLL